MNPPRYQNGKEAWAVKVENIPNHIGYPEILTLFKTLIGDVKSSESKKDGLVAYLEISFHNQDAFRKALCMSGYAISGRNLSVNPATAHTFYRTPNLRKRSETRRNLYVLGLPFDLTKSDFADVFSRYGTVSHCVVLATLDNASRRRGFVVMSSHEEAKAAMTGLSGSQIKGHTLDISWAVVQRSQGFLDGGDRSLTLESNPNPLPSSQTRGMTFAPSDSPNTSGSSVESDLPTLTTSLLPTSTLLISELPAFLFSETSDLQPLLYPFGSIKKLEMMGTSSERALSGKASVIVEFQGICSAKEAKETLHGQHYANTLLKAEYIRSAPSDLGNGGSSLAPGNFEKKILNPLAADFVLAHPGTHIPSRVYYGQTRPMLQSNALARARKPFIQINRSFPSVPFELSGSRSQASSRPSSASSKWSSDCSRPPSASGGRYAFMSLPNLNTQNAPFF